MRRPPRVALVFGTYPPERNGGADFLARFAAALATAGAEVTVLTSRAEEEPTDGVTVLRAVGDWSSRAEARSAGALLRSRDVELVHVFFPDSVLGADYRLPSWLRGFPLVTTFWNLGLGRRSPAAVKRTALALLARSSALTSHDPGYLATLRVLGGGRPVQWLPVGNNLGRPCGPPAPEGATIAYFGQVDFTRGLEDLFEALRLARACRDVRLVMIGSAGREERYGTEAFGAYYRRVRELPKELGIADAVEWTGYLPDGEVLSVLASASLCVLPYRRNSVGRSALASALEVGLPTILAGEVVDVAPLRAGRDVALVPRGQPAALAKTIVALLDDETERRRLAAGARGAARLFAWPRIASGALALYRRVLG